MKAIERALSNGRAEKSKSQNELKADRSSAVNAVHYGWR